jgi:sulfatase maturation enzyme AslB (radical SAM superfamily)
MKYSIKIDLNSSCNLRCKYCNTDKIIHNYNILNTIKIFLNLNIFTISDIVVLEFKKQEPFYTLNNLESIFKIFIIDSIAKGYKVSFQIVTNGTLLGKYEIRKFLYGYKKYISSFILSLDGYKDVQDLQRPGSWNKIVENWDFLRKYTNDNIIINSVCSNYSFAIYAKSLIRLLNNFKGISILISVLDKIRENSLEEIQYYIREVTILLYFLKTKNIIFYPLLYPIENKCIENKISYILNKNIKKEDKIIPNKCINCNHTYCDGSFEFIQSSRRIDKQCYLTNELNRLHNLYIEKEEN